MTPVDSGALRIITLFDMTENSGVLAHVSQATRHRDVNQPAATQGAPSSPPYVPDVPGLAHSPAQPAWLVILALYRQYLLPNAGFAEFGCSIYPNPRFESGIPMLRP